MDWITILGQIFQIVIIPILGVATTFLIAFLRKKTAEIQGNIDNELYAKYLGLLVETAIICVQTTTQTYVYELKQQGAFDKEAQKIAFQMSFNAVIAALTDEAKMYLNEMVGDFELYLTNLIESLVFEGNKKPIILPTPDNDKATDYMLGGQV